MGADGERVTQVLDNLIGNALKFTPEGRSVIVDVTSEAERVSFSVTDTGPGIPRFYQVRATPAMALAPKVASGGRG